LEAIIAFVFHSAALALRADSPIREVLMVDPEVVIGG
jgi:hypothetical protein